MSEEKWKSDLDSLFKEKASREEKQAEDLEINKKKVSGHISSVVFPAFKELKAELEKHGREVKIYQGEDSASIEVIFQGNKEIDYRFRVNVSPHSTHPYPETQNIDKDGKRFTSEGTFMHGSQSFNIEDVTKEIIIDSFMENYKRRP